MASVSEQKTALDSYDDDLVWIMGRLVARVGGSFGFLARFLEDDSVSMLALGGSIPEQLIDVPNAAAVAARKADHGERRRREDAAPLRQTALNFADPGLSWRLLYLPFRPAANVSLVAGVCREDATTPYTPIQEATAATLYSVLERYIKLWWLHRTERHRANALCTALDLADVGVLLLDRRSKLVFANHRANALLDDADGLRRSDHSIAAEHFGDGVQLQAAMQHAIHCSLRTEPLRQRRQQAPLFSLRRRAGKRPLIATVASVEHEPVDPDDPAVIVYVLDPEQDVQQLLTPVCSIYRLTTAESRLVYHLVSGLTIVDAAREMQIQPDTARAYLKQIFSKTDTNRQADLVRIMLSSLLRTSARLEPSLL